MKFPSLLVRALPVMAVCVAIANPSNAKEDEHEKGYVTVYMGKLKGEEEGLTVERPTAGESAFRLTDYTGWAAGARIGNWNRSNPVLGYAMDFFYQSQGGTQVDFNVVTFAPMIMARLPLGRNADRPDGLLSVYAGIGPTFNRVHMVADLQPELSRRIDDYEFTIGYQWAVGARFGVTPAIGIVAEYKFMADDFTINEFEESSCFACPDVLTGEARLNTHLFLIGISFQM